MVHKMTEHSPRVRRKRARRMQNILDTAMQILIDGGLDELTIHRLADRLDLTPGALYRYFSSKGDILAALEAQVLQELSEMLGEVQEVCERYLVKQPAPAHPAALLPILASFSFYIKLPELLPARFHLISLIVGHPLALVPDEQAPLLMQAAMKMLSHNARLVGAAQQAGALQAGPALERSVAMWGAVQGVLQLRKLGRHEPFLADSPRLSRHIIDGLLLGWGASPSALVDAQERLGALDAAEPLARIGVRPKPDST